MSTIKKKSVFEQHQEMSNKYGIKAVEKKKTGPKPKPKSELQANNVIKVYLNDSEIKRVNNIVGNSSKSEFIRQLLLEAIEEIETEP